jgi:hypothetical protein
MKKLIVITIALVTMTATNAPAITAFGSSFGNLATAKAMGQGNGVFGFGVGIADAKSVVGWFNYGLSEYIDGRLKLGLVDTDASDAEIAFGADFKYQFWSVNGAVANPLDMAVGGFLEYTDYGGLSALQVGGQLIGSYPFRLQNGTTLSPYGRFNIRLEDWNSDYKGDKASDSELEFGLNGGVAWQVTSTINVYGEFQIDGNDGIFLGIDFSVL